MRTAFAIVTCLAWALWFGGLIALFLFVQRLFASDRDLAAQAAPMLFATFERYQMLLAAAALLAAFGWRLAVRTRLQTAIFALLALAAAAAALGPIYISRPMHALRVQGLSGSPQFKRLHGGSMVLYVSQAASLAGAGAMLPVALRRQAAT